ncbi:hypothetical protein KC333_g9507, partial [Hortaea werneckii]
MRAADRPQYPFRTKRRAREGSGEPVRKVARTRTPSAAELHPPPGLRRERAARFTPSAASPQTESRQTAALPRLAATPNPRVRRAEKEMRQRAAGEENISSGSGNESEGSKEWNGNTDVAPGQDGSSGSRQGLVWRLAAPESQLKQREFISIESFDGNCKCPFYSECGKVGRFFELATHFSKSKRSRLSNHRRWDLHRDLSAGQTRLVLTKHDRAPSLLNITSTEPLVREAEGHAAYCFDEHALIALTHEHKRIELDLPSERWIKCPFCYRKYPNLCQLRSHINGSRGRHAHFEVEPLVSTDEGLKRLRLDVRPSLLLEKHGPDPALGLALKECQDPGKKRLHRLTLGTTTAKENSALLAAWRTSCGRMPRLWKNFNQTFSLSALQSRLLEAAKSPGVLRDAKST